MGILSLYTKSGQARVKIKCNESGIKGNKEQEQEQMEWMENGDRKWENCKQGLGTEKKKQE